MTHQFEQLLQCNWNECHMNGMNAERRVPFLRTTCWNSSRVKANALESLSTADVAAQSLIGVQGHVNAWTYFDLREETTTRRFECLALPMWQFCVLDICNGHDMPSFSVQSDQDFISRTQIFSICY